MKKVREVEKNLMDFKENNHRFGKKSSILKQKFMNFKNVFHLKIVCAFVKEKEKEFENSSWIWPKMDLKKVHIIKKTHKL